VSPLSLGLVLSPPGNSFDPPDPHLLQDPRYRFRYIVISALLIGVEFPSLAQKPEVFFCILFFFSWSHEPLLSYLTPTRTKAPFPRFQNRFLPPSPASIFIQTQFCVKKPPPRQLILRECMCPVPKDSRNRVFLVFTKFPQSRLNFLSDLPCPQCTLKSFTQNASSLRYYDRPAMIPHSVQSLRVKNRFSILIFFVQLQQEGLTSVLLFFSTLRSIHPRLHFVES